MQSLGTARCAEIIKLTDYIALEIKKTDFVPCNSAVWMSGRMLHAGGEANF